MQIRKRSLEFVRGGVIEAAGHRDVADTRPDYVSLRHRRLGHCAASDLDGLDLSGRPVLHGNFDFGAPRSEQELAYLGKGLTAHRLPVDLHDLIAKAKPGARRGRLLKCRANEGVDLVTVAQVANRGPDAEILRALLGLERRVLDWVKVGRMRIEHAQHAAD